MSEKIDVKNLHLLYKKDMLVKVNDSPGSHDYIQRFVTNLVEGKVVDVKPHCIYLETISCLKHPRYELLIPTYEKQVTEFNPFYLTNVDIQSILLASDKVDLSPDEYLDVWQRSTVKERDAYIENKMKTLSFLEDQPILVPSIRLYYKNEVHLPLI